MLTSRFSKSGSASRPHPRLKRTLKRGAGFRAFQEDDLRWLWLFYRKGQLLLPEGMSNTDFKAQITDQLLIDYDYAWVLEGSNETSTDVGLLFGRNAGADYGVEPEALILVGDAMWLPWTTGRNKLEAILAFLAGIRGEATLMFSASTKMQTRFYTQLCRYGVAHRVGTIVDLGIALFQTKWPKVRIE